MKTLGIDLSLNSTGIFCEGIHELITPTKTSSEQRLIDISNSICSFVEQHNPDVIGLEGLSYNSISASKDELAANFWMLRCELHKQFPNIPVKIIQVTEWRDPLFTKVERKQWTADKKQVKELKIQLKLISDKKEKSKILLENEQLILNSNIKYLTWCKLPLEYQTKFKEYGFNNGCFDLVDAFYISEHLKGMTI